MTRIVSASYMSVPETCFKSIDLADTCQIKIDIHTGSAD